MYTTESNSCELTSTYHPNGMLDRDQRTAKTLSELSKTGSELQYSLQTCSQSKSKCCYKTLLHNSNVNATKPSSTSSSSSSSLSTCNNHHHHPRQSTTTESVLFIYNCCKNRITCNSNGQSDSYRKSSNNNLFHCQLSPISNTLNSQTSISHKKLTGNGIQQQQQMPKCMTTTTKSKSSSYALSTSSFYSKSMKFSNLLVCICLWLLICQKTRAMPISPSCEIYSKAFKMILNQAKMSYAINLEVFKDFTNTYFHQDHTYVHDEWKHKTIDSLKPITMTSRQKEPEFYDRPDDEAVAHLKGPFSKSLAREELQELYERLTILQSAFKYITDGDNVIDDYDSKYYKDHQSYLKMLTEEVGASLDNLDINRPDVKEPSLSQYSKELRDYFVMRQHLIVLKYVIDAYEILKSTCPSDM